MRFHIYQILQLISLITAIAYFKELKRFKLTAFIPLLIIVCVTEGIAANYKFFGWKSNYAVYNIYFVFSTPVSLYLSYNMLEYKGIARSLFIFISICVSIFLLCNVLFIQGTIVIATYSYFAAMSAMVVFSFLVVLRLFLDDDSSLLLNQHPYFWINAATVIFSIGALFIMGISGFIKNHKVQISGHNIYQYVTQALNYVLYGAYIYAFWLCKKLTKPQAGDLVSMPGHDQA